ncbi:hypothetical protein B0H19DRAFT_1258189 [Mycena capillaripes]|nr:hypothetical protein B0H19DRAFT_1258189 [Mycena capillaripes]
MTYVLLTTAVSAGMYSNFHGVVHNHDGAPVSLTPNEQQAFIDGYRVQTSSTTADILRFLFHPVDIAGCSTSKKCFKVRLQAMESNRESFRIDMSATLDVWGEDECKSLDLLCPSCITTLSATHQKARQACWDKIPEIYGLPSWDELEQMKVAAIGPSLLA